MLQSLYWLDLDLKYATKPVLASFTFEDLLKFDSLQGLRKQIFFHILLHHSPVVFIRFGTLFPVQVIQLVQGGYDLVVLGKPVKVLIHQLMVSLPPHMDNGSHLVLPSSCLPCIRVLGETGV